MIRTLAIAATLIAGLAGTALAQTACSCGSGTRVFPQAALATFLGGRTACAALGADRWQEFHSGSGTGGGPLIDWKRGSSSTTDPTETVGSWSIQGTGSSAKVRHSYTGGSSYDYEVCDGGGGVVRFCGAVNVNGTLLSGQVACP